MLIKINDNIKIEFLQTNILHLSIYLISCWFIISVLISTLVALVVVESTQEVQLNG